MIPDITFTIIVSFLCITLQSFHNFYSQHKLTTVRFNESIMQQLQFFMYYFCLFPYFVLNYNIIYVHVAASSVYLIKFMYEIIRNHSIRFIKKINFQYITKTVSNVCEKPFLYKIKFIEAFEVHEKPVNCCLFICLCFLYLSI